MTGHPPPTPKNNLMFGLSADPIHSAHSQVLISVIRALKQHDIHIHNIFIVPVYRRNPVGETHKTSLPETFDHRLATCQIAGNAIESALSDPSIKVTITDIARTLSLKTSKPNYDVETLKALMQRGEEWFYQISSDLLTGEKPEFSQWHQPELLARLATLVIVHRPLYPLNETYLDQIAAARGRFIILDDLPHIAISSTRIRQRLALGEDPTILADEGLLHPAVAEYIRSNNIYLE